MSITADRFRAAVESGDIAAAESLLADDVTFHSPVKFTPFEGKAIVMAVLGFVTQVFEDFRYVGELEGTGSRADEGEPVPSEILVFRAAVEGKAIHGLDLLQLDEDGLISEFTVMVRPMSAVVALKDAMNKKMVEAGFAPASVLQG
ncbi:nuclear transport factor 2 family protein [Mumia zhuanghuii]|uniref:Nuclear transport factor 2 family protein n=2 Tax=Mumia TaxID=1546255 RepID=A0ABW1QLA6_9ACTN|nr:MULTISPECIES: nuclear transport factor 2 family protein [Mumia]KAA1424938.1 nuclear transport factor 2 family protein [Mumia zhuanghuii]